MKSKFKSIPVSILELIKKTPIYKSYLIKSNKIVKYKNAKTILDTAPELLLERPISPKPKIGIVRDPVMIDDYVSASASWLRYERFCISNSIEYEFYDVFRSDWIANAKRFDIILWSTSSTPSIQYIAESKIYILEKVMQKFCFPSFDEVWQYEDKIRSNFLYQCLDIQTIPTLITNSKSEALVMLRKIHYPIITKTKIGSSSSGVQQIRSKRSAIKRVGKIFSYKGLKTQYRDQNQKDYFYIQKFVKNSGFDLRVIIVGNRAFGYYRYPNNGDFRASGSGIVEKKALPKDALLLAIEVRNKLGSRQLGVDMLYSEDDNKYLVIETSLFNQIDTPEQLFIDGKPGYYDISDPEKIVFVEGRFWVQELLLSDLISQWALERM